MDSQYPNNLPQEKPPIKKNERGMFSTLKQNKQKTVANCINIFAVVGVISLLSLGALGTLKLAGVSPQTLVAAVSNLTSIFVPTDNNEPITFNLKTHNVEMGIPFILTWTDKISQSGTYVFQYECREGVSAQTKNSDGLVKEITCDTPFSFENEDNSITLNFFSTKDRFVDLPITITFISKDSTEVTQQGSTLLTLINKKLQGEGSSLQEKITTDNFISRGAKTRETRLIGTKNNIVNNPSGTPDLKVKVLATGVVDKITNDFTPSNAIKTKDRAAIRFEVRNVGTKESGQWSFIIDLPLSSGTYVFRPDDKQRSLKPGERVEYTLGFDSIDRTSNKAEAVINVDTERLVPEKNLTNNTDTAIIEFAQN